jgi:hypothetical protein
VVLVGALIPAIPDDPEAAREAASFFQLLITDAKPRMSSAIVD